MICKTNNKQSKHSIKRNKTTKGLIDLTVSKPKSCCLWSEGLWLTFVIITTGNDNSITDNVYCRQLPWFTGHGKSRKCSLHRMPCRLLRMLGHWKRLSFGRIAAPTCLVSANSWTSQVSKRSHTFWIWPTPHMLQHSWNSPARLRFATERSTGSTAKCLEHCTTSLTEP